ncbi:MAG: [FeFe] hydrogenase H-cluster radical SAM maturase HydG [Planctomycetota bacterium]|jgi:2-iminoacetate synthase|nr:[FeFe] hydrogenase H-cluster radical SAM maturase HydG [Planctomycetota bacterium]
MPDRDDADSADHIDDDEIERILAANRRPDRARVRDILVKARNLAGLDMSEAAALMPLSDPALLAELFAAANEVKNAIYGRRIVLFSPLYVSNLCANECLYCAFRVRNREVRRRVLSMEEIADETLALIEQGHKRVLLVAGEAYPAQEGFQYVLDAIRTIYSVKSGPGEIRRVNANIAPLTEDEFRRLKETGIGTFQLFQETFHRETYAKVHVAGRKTDYAWRVTAFDRAMRAGIDDCGIGVLFGLFNWHYEILAMLQQIRHLEKRFGVGPHTISVPRIEPAIGSDMARHPPAAVSDIDFRKIVAILRLTVPYTGIIMSTRETANLRQELFALGVSQISGGSRTNPGGYTEAGAQNDGEAQFSLGDQRTLGEVIRDVAKLGLVPSFCTGCYRLGRTGKDFMDLAKPGDIRRHCDPNAFSTFQEYLIDYASPETRTVGENLIRKELGNMEPPVRLRTEEMLSRVRSGKRDVFC